MTKWQQKDSRYSLEKEKYTHPIPSRKYIISVLQQSAKGLSFAALAKVFKLNKAEAETLKYRIRAMLRDGELEKGAKAILQAPKNDKPKLRGKVFAHAEGYGFFIPEDKTLTGGDDLFLSYREMQRVMHGDTVEATELNNTKNTKKEGRIVSVVVHANKKIIARIDQTAGKPLVTPENRRIHHKIRVENLADITVGDNDIVEIEITTYPHQNQPIIGKITKILGHRLDVGIEIDVAINSHNLPHEWPEDVTQQTLLIPDALEKNDYNQRVDLRDTPWVTIDGITAKDFDDAVFAKKTPSGYLLYVAIADVSHYVEKESPLDCEATNRATSVYFPNRVIPMLPEKLSNGLCSLNPDVDRLALVCEMLIDHTGEIKRTQFYEAVIRSHARLTYETVEDILFHEVAQLDESHAYLLPHLQTLKALYLTLRAQSQQRGAIGFHTREPEFEYDANGKIERILAKKSLKSHQLIEEFMVRANLCAGKFLLKQKGKNKPLALFRNHLGPSQEKLEKLITALAQEGIHINQTETISAKQLAQVIKKIKGRDNFEALQMLVLRSMYQALYQAHNEGHFGLALPHYAHFTSPIRRYPDLLVHRAIKHGIKHQGESYPYSLVQMQGLGEQCSIAERRADDAVYDVIGYLKCEYLADKRGQQYAATISSVTSFGLFATLDDHFVDGLIHISTLDGDYFHYDEKNLFLIGERSRKIYKIGDSVDIIVSDVNPDARRIDFVLTPAHLPFHNKKAGEKKRPSKKHRRRK